MEDDELDSFNAEAVAALRSVDPRRFEYPSSCLYTYRDHGTDDLVAWVDLGGEPTLDLLVRVSAALPGRASVEVWECGTSEDLVTGVRLVVVREGR